MDTGAARSAPEPGSPGHAMRTEQGARRLWVLALGTFAIGTGGFVIAGVLPGIAHNTTSTLAAAGLLVTAFALVYAVAAPLFTAAVARTDHEAARVSGCSRAPAARPCRRIRRPHRQASRRAAARPATALEGTYPALTYAGSWTRPGALTANIFPSWGRAAVPCHRMARLWPRSGKLMTTDIDVAEVLGPSANFGPLNADGTGHASSGRCPDVMVIAARGTGEAPSDANWQNPSHQGPYGALGERLGEAAGEDHRVHHLGGRQHRDHHGRIPDRLGRRRGPAGCGRPGCPADQVWPLPRNQTGAA